MKGSQKASWETYQMAQLWGNEQGDEPKHATVDSENLKQVRSSCVSRVQSTFWFSILFFAIWLELEESFQLFTKTVFSQVNNLSRKSITWPILGISIFWGKYSLRLGAPLALSLGVSASCLEISYWQEKKIFFPSIQRGFSYVQVQDLRFHRWAKRGPSVLIAFHLPALRSLTRGTRRLQRSALLRPPQDQHVSCWSTSGLVLTPVLLLSRQYKRIFWLHLPQFSNNALGISFSLFFWTRSIAGILLFLPRRLVVCTLTSS